MRGLPHETQHKAHFLCFHANQQWEESSFLFLVFGPPWNTYWPTPGARYKIHMSPCCGDGKVEEKGRGPERGTAGILQGSKTWTPVSRILWNSTERDPRVKYYDLLFYFKVKGFSPSPKDFVLLPQSNVASLIRKEPHVQYKSLSSLSAFRHQSLFPERRACPWLSQSRFF